MLSSELTWAAVDVSEGDVPTWGVAVADDKPQGMGAKRIADAVTAVAMPVVQAEGLELDRVEVHGTGRTATLQVFIDKPGGVTVDDCVSVSKQLSALLDVHDVVPGSYTLEVSSPGLTRPLEGEADFRRFAGRYVIVKAKVPLERGDYQVTGWLRGVEDGNVVVESGEDRHAVRVPLDKVTKARLEIEE